jgi:hypothetical protein
VDGEDYEVGTTTSGFANLNWKCLRFITTGIFFFGIILPFLKKSAFMLFLSPFGFFFGSRL